MEIGRQEGYVAQQANDWTNHRQQDQEGPRLPREMHEFITSRDGDAIAGLHS